MMKGAQEQQGVAGRRTPAAGAMRGVRVWASVAAVAAIVLGIIHDAALPTQMDGVQPLTQANQDGFVWLFLCTGTAVAFAGVVCLLAAGGLARGEIGARRATLAAGVFLALLGVVGLAAHQIGALGLIVLAVLSLIPWWRTRRMTAAGGA